MTHDHSMGGAAEFGVRGQTSWGECIQSGQTLLHNIKSNHSQISQDLHCVKINGHIKCLMVE